MAEFSLIERYFSHWSTTCRANASVARVDLGVGDDCALLSVPDDQQLAISVDTLNADVHFPANAKASLIAQRALAVAISDLAAMGANPLSFTLALSLPELDESWISDFSHGLKQSAESYGVALMGGDTTCGPLSITLQVHGTVPRGYALTRSGAQLGDCIYVTGTLGDAAAALAVMENRLTATEMAEHFFSLRYYQPRARLEVGESLHDIATAAIDISDGLAADLAHILAASKVGAEIHAGLLPISNALQGSCSKEQVWQFALAGGDDYELCFTAPPEKREQLKELAELIDVPITEIGRIVMAPGLNCLDIKGQSMSLPRTGYQHFSDNG